MLIGAYVVCNYARTSLTTSGDAFESKRNVPNWEIDELQEKLVQEWAESKQIWFPNAEEEIESVYGSMIALSYTYSNFVYIDFLTISH